MKLLSESTGFSRMRSVLAASNTNISGSYVETRKCYNCGEVGHLNKVCPKPPRERETVRRRQFGGRGGRRGGRAGSYGGHGANVTVAEEEEETHSTYSVEEKDVLEMWRRMKLVSDGSNKATTEGAFIPSSSRGNDATYAHSDTGDLPREGDRPETWDWHMA